MIYYTEYNIYCGFINTMGLYIRLSYFHPFQQFFIHIDKFYPFFIHCSSNLPTLNNVEKIVWPTVYAVLGVVVSWQGLEWRQLYNCIQFIWGFLLQAHYTSHPWQSLTVIQRKSKIGQLLVSSLPWIIQSPLLLRVSLVVPVLHQEPSIQRTLRLLTSHSLTVSPNTLLN
jgi:hypothetical protein